MKHPSVQSSLWINRVRYSTQLKIIKRILTVFFKSPFFIVAIPIVFFVRIIRPWLLIRFGMLNSLRIGHFAANTELYLCELDAAINKPKQQYVDFFYLSDKPECNTTLTKMWQRTINILPAWILAPIKRINKLIPGGSVHEIGTNTQHDRDVHNLLDNFPSHIQLTDSEESRGQAILRALGIPLGSRFVCLIGRDSAYLESKFKSVDFSYHNYRDVDIQNYVLAAEELANRGYYVLRMGVEVREPINSSHRRVIDYATHDLRSDFMDIYLGAKCAFCISCGTGFDAIPLIFRRPVVFVNHVPIGYLFTFQKHTLGLTKRHFSVIKNRELTLKEIVQSDLCVALMSSDYETKHVKLLENSPEEIRDIVVEMSERLEETWDQLDDDESLQEIFWDIFPTDILDVYQQRPLHGTIKSRFGTNFLRNNSWWLQ